MLHTILYSLAILFLTFLCPLWLVLLHKYKMYELNFILKVNFVIYSFRSIRGAWEEAVVTEQIKDKFD
jgi:uncharacterized membrane protein YbhN (UPF0104 family)